ncbi:MAG: M28 family peptidase [Lewinellaceae bacterium]|nr:M28 family peptidase [Lewinellaceae bacterium]
MTPALWGRSFIAVLFCLLLSSPVLKAQKDSLTAQLPLGYFHSGYKLPDPVPFAQTITPADLKWLLDSLASPSMQGRETGEVGQKVAANFIADQFKDAGLPPEGDRRTYFQTISLQKTSWEDLSLTIDGQEYKNRSDYFVMHSYNKDNPAIQVKEFVFVGYGIEDNLYNDYAGVDVKGKTVVFYAGEPVDEAGVSRVMGNVKRSNWSVDWRRKVELAAQKGAVLAIIVDPRFQEDMKINRKIISTYGWKTVGSDSAALETGMINNIFVTEETANAIFGKKASKVAEAMKSINEGGKVKAMKMKTNMEVHLHKVTQLMEGSNVIGFIEGSDPELKKEYVFVTAHYDHLGENEGVIYFGADDNASGTSAVIEIARAFAEAKKKGVGPKRSVVCMLVSGEEKGLLGSRFYTDFPVFSLKNTVVDINIDMIGRIDKEHEGKGDYVYVIGSDRLSTELHELNERNNRKYTKMELDYRYNDPKDPNHYYERSDHYNFAEKGIPAIFFFNGTHADYHRPSDTADKINFDMQAKRAQLAFYVAWDIANRPTRLRADKLKKDLGKAEKEDQN